MSLFGKSFHKEQNDLAEREKHTEQMRRRRMVKALRRPWANLPMYMHRIAIHPKLGMNRSCNGMICRKMRESV